jgi:hypothetical protein
VGKTILLDAVPYTVIGVLPAWFDYPDTRVQLWQAVNHEVSMADIHNRGNHRFFVIARLKDGVSLAQAYSELDAIQQRNHKQFPNELMGKGANLLPLSDNLVRDVKSSLYLLIGQAISHCPNCRKTRWWRHGCRLKSAKFHDETESLIGTPLEHARKARSYLTANAGIRPPFQ